MKIAIDGIIMQIQPDGMSWEPPRDVSRDGDYAPVRGQFYSCRLSFGRALEPSFYDWQQAANTRSHLVTMPHPMTGVMTDFCCYVGLPVTRMDTSDQSDHCAIINGVDITLSGIVLDSVPAYPFSFSFCPE